MVFLKLNIKKMSIAAKNRFDNLDHINSHKLFSGKGGSAQKGYKYIVKMEDVKKLFRIQKNQIL